MTINKDPKVVGGATSDKFDVKLTIGVSVKKEGRDGNFYSANSEINYTGMDYLEMNATNAALVKFAEILTNFGWDAAELKGFNKQLIEATKASLAKA